MSEPEVSETLDFAPGAFLKKTREQKGLSVSEVAAQLKLMDQSLHNIEADDYKDIPITFYKGYIKNYAQLLGLDPQSLADNFSEYIAKNGLDKEAKQKSYRGVTAKKSNNLIYARLFAKLISFLIILALLYSVYYLLSEKGYWNKFINSFDKQDPAQEQPLETDDNEGELIPETQVIEVPSSNSLSVPVDSINQKTEVSNSSEQELAIQEQTAASATDAQTQDSTDDSIAYVANLLRFEFSGDCWIQVVDDNGRILISGTKRLGHSSEVTGEPPYKLTIGKVSNVTVTFEGKEIDLSAYSDARIAKLVIGA
mgnify:CR=1 FL=1